MSDYFGQKRVLVQHCEVQRSSSELSVTAVYQVSLIDVAACLQQQHDDVPLVSLHCPVQSGESW